jgi:hypothetical protein
MTGPGWLADGLAVAMIATAVYCVSRIVAARRWRRLAACCDIVMGLTMGYMLILML